MKKVNNYYLKDKYFDDLFDQCINLVTKNKDQGNKEIVNAVSDVYEIKEYIPEIMMIEKKLGSKLLVFTYVQKEILNESNSITSISNSTYNSILRSNYNTIDLGFTLRSFYTFFSMYYFNDKIDEFIDKSMVSEVILPAIEKVLSYLAKHIKED